MNKKIIGLVGGQASGKGTIAKYLIEKHGAGNLRFSTMLRDILNRLYLDVSRENMQNLSTIIREAFGQDLMSKVIAEDAIKDPNPILVIDGVRRFTDITYLKEIEGFTLVSVEADPKIRYERLVKRAENPGDAEKTFEEFLADHEKEADREVPEVMKEADVIINNDGNFEALYKQIDELIAK